MKTCKKCNAILDDDAVFCNECGAKYEDEKKPSFEDFAKEAGSGLSKFAESSGKALSQTAENLKKNYQESQANRINFIKFADGEIFIREYQVTKIFFPRVAGNLMITNKRVIFYSLKGSDRVMLSTPLNTVGSINFVSGKYFNILLIVLGLIFILAALNSYDSKLLGTILGLVCLFFGIKKSIYLSISSVNSSPAIIVGKGNTVGTTLYSIDGVAGVDADRAMSEIGAIILDLQQMGDLAIEKWKQ